MEVVKKWEMTVHNTGHQISFIPVGSDIRSSVCQLYVDHDVGLMHGIQGEDFFRAIHEHLDDMFSIVKYFTGHILKHHIDIYERIGLIVDVHHYSKIDDKEVAWAMVYRS